jgi:hypothetical protein
MAQRMKTKTSTSRVRGPGFEEEEIQGVQETVDIGDDGFEHVLRTRRFAGSCAS